MPSSLGWSSRIAQDSSLPRAPKSPFDTPPSSWSNDRMSPPAPSFVDFFAGSGLVTQGAKHACVPVGRTRRKSERVERIDCEDVRADIGESTRFKVGMLDWLDWFSVATALECPTPFQRAVSLVQGRPLPPTTSSRAISHSQ